MRAKKSLGQHFLVSRPVVERILYVCRLEAQGADGILEIGPGRGVLTEGLQQMGRPFWAMELDYALAVDLQRRAPHLRVVLGDARRLDLPHLAEESGLRSWLVAGNLPYNAGTQILGRVLEAPEHVAAAVVMLQREVALKFCAAAGEEGYGPLAAGAAPWWEGRILFTVRPGAFRPEPKVTSAVCLVKPRPAPLLPCGELERFRSFAGSAFAQPRKTLASNLSEAGIGRGHTETALTAAGLPPDARPGRTPPEVLVGLLKLAGRTEQG